MKKVTIKRWQSFAPLSDALGHKFTSLTRRKKSRLNPVLVGVLGACNACLSSFTIFGLTRASSSPPALWEYQAKHGGALPDKKEDGKVLETIVEELLSTKNVKASEINQLTPEFLSFVIKNRFLLLF
jgi:hypothetical protein